MRCLAICSACLLLLVCATGARSATSHSRFQPNPGAARFWTHHFFGRGPEAQRALCIAYTESRYELGVSNAGSYGPWQINAQAHPWVSAYRVTHSWRYAAAVAWRISGHGTNFSPWRPDCGL